MQETYIYPQVNVEESVEISGKKALAYLAWFKGQLDPFLDAYFDEKIKEAVDIHPEAAVLVEELHRFAHNGGKRVRPALSYAAYMSAGGRSLDAILYASASLELLHAFALIHDDIMDGANLRRGQPSAHKVFEQFHQKRDFLGSSEKFGSAAAILAGDLALAYADNIINSAPFPAERIRRAKFYYDEMKKQVILGQYLDITASAKKTISEKELLKILEYKTAKYTIERPLHIGAALAGAEEELLGVFSSYAVPLGQAFQIQDDIVGTFGEEEKIGKPTDSDIKEGKKTLLVIKAYERASSSDKKILDGVIGNQKATREDIETAREIIRTTGSLEYSQTLATRLINQAKQTLLNTKMVDEGREYLLQAADYLLGR